MIGCAYPQINVQPPKFYFNIEENKVFLASVVGFNPAGYSPCVTVLTFTKVNITKNYSMSRLNIRETLERFLLALSTLEAIKIPSKRLLLEVLNTDSLSTLSQHKKQQ